MTALFSVPAFFWRKISSIGSKDIIDEYERRKLSVFNHLNSIGVVCGIVLPVIGLFDDQELPTVAWLVALSPAIISSIVLYLNASQKHEAARMVYFSCYPVITSLVYAAGLDVGVELFFILYGILAVFYMQKRSNGIIAFLLAVSCYIIVYVFFDNYPYKLRTASLPFYALNHLVAIIFIFFSLSWLKRENNAYQQDILAKNKQLAELDAVKNKLFSVISHDLKTPMYALRNLFRNVETYDLPGDELKMMVPDIVNDLNYTTSLMENLLHWAKLQMQAAPLQTQKLNITLLVQEITQLLRLQAESKHIYITSKIEAPVYVYADKEMLNLVLRNLISNAIKFTPQQGNVIIETRERGNNIEVLVKDDGIGMAPDVVEKIGADSNFYSSTGTANETGTGLGLMLCQDFLKKIGSRIFIQSEQGRGSTFSFVLPKTNYS